MPLVAAVCIAVSQFCRNTVFVMCYMLPVHLLLWAGAYNVPRCLLTKILLLIHDDHVAFTVAELLCKLMVNCSTSAFSLQSDRQELTAEMNYLKSAHCHLPQIVDVYGVCVEKTCVFICKPYQMDTDRTYEI